MTTTVDPLFIRRAVEYADLAALRIAIFQACGDPEIARLGPVASLSPEDRDRLIERCVELLSSDLPHWRLRVPSDEEIRTMLDMVLGVPTPEGDFDLRKQVLSFEDYPFFADWPDGSGKVPEDFHVAIVGGGFNGIATAVQFEQLGIPYTVYERRSELGGTWSIHSYPDIRVDTLSASYEFSFEKSYPWTEYFARGPEVKAYLNHIATRFGVMPKVRFDHDLVEARFDDDTARWEVTFRRTDGSTSTRTVNAIVSAAGLFANPKQPEFPGVEAFGGTVIHPSRWPADLDLTGKRVAVIGNGSTGVQLLARVAEMAGHTDVFVRTPQWISPRDKYGRHVEPETRWLIDSMPGYWNWCRITSIMHLFNFHRDFLIRDPEFEATGGRITQTSENVRAFLTDYIRTETGGRQDLIDRLMPDHAPMVRRPIVDNGWYRALTRDDVELVTSEIVRFTAGGIETADGLHHDLDIVITATGFDIVKYLWPAEYFGRGGANLHDRWEEETPMAYVGMMVPDFPNLFILYGPNSQPVSGGVALPAWYQMWAGFVARCLTGMIEGGHSTVEVTREAFEEYNRRLVEESQRIIMVTEETSKHKNYYVNSRGRMQVNAPWETCDYFRMTSYPDPEAIVFD
ncbi:MAG: NAD(P)/FAD-dependent oxidoreductase [Acidobacteria bacterium]|nr:NAD(P)/FAD-dependent oxidoreductase [Acidobacteriota bacterium]